MFLKRLETTLIDINTLFPDVNNGGCGCMALLLHNVMHKAYYTKIVGKMADNSLANPTHIWIEITNHKGEPQVAIDSTGVYRLSNTTCFIYQKYAVNRETCVIFPQFMLKSLCDRKWVWNPTFKRAHLPIIKDMLHRGLEL